jgi:hypothetical protein
MVNHNINVLYKVLPEVPGRHTANTVCLRTRINANLDRPNTFFQMNFVSLS